MPNPYAKLSAAIETVERVRQFIHRCFILTLGAPVVVAIVGKLFYTVDGGQRAVVFDRFRGVLNSTAGEGAHFCVPWFQKTFIFDCRTRAYTFSSVSGTKDLQMVKLTLRVLSRPQIESLPDIFNSLGQTYDETVLPSIVQESIKTVVSQFNADQLLTERCQFSTLLREKLSHKAKNFYIQLDDVAITELSYSAEFSKAVEQKQLAREAVEQSKLVVGKAEQEKKGAIIRAEGESMSGKVICDASATSSEGLGLLLELYKFEAVKDNAVAMSGNKNVMYMSGKKKQESNISAHC